MKGARAELVMADLIDVVMDANGLSLPAAARLQRWRMTWCRSDAAGG
jgi:hypothetical protein